MKVTLIKSSHQQKVFGAGLCVLRRNNIRHLCMAVQAGELKKLVRVVSARKWLIHQGCPPEMARQLVYLALENRSATPTPDFAQLMGYAGRLKNG